MLANELLCKEFLRAASHGDVKRVKELMQRQDVDVNYCAEWEPNKTAFHRACEGNHAEVVKLLLEKGVRGDAMERAFCARKPPSAQVVTLLLEYGLDPAVQQNLGFRAAAWSGGLELVQLLLRDPRVDPACLDNDAFCRAAENGKWEIVQVLLCDPRVDPAARQNSALIKACSLGHKKVVELLLADPRTNPGDLSNSAIRCAVRRGLHVRTRPAPPDPRVDRTGAIASAKACVLPLLLEDEHCGIIVNRAVFEKLKPDAVERYDELVRERTARICSVSWTMKQIGQGWGDLREPLEERLQRQPVDWDKK